MWIFNTFPFASPNWSDFEAHPRHHWWIAWQRPGYEGPNANPPIPEEKAGLISGFTMNHHDFWINPLVRPGDFFGKVAFLGGRVLGTLGTRYILKAVKVEICCG